MLKYIQTFCLIKTGQKVISFPQVPLSSGFKLEGDENFLYEMSEGLDPNVLYIYRKNGNPMTDEDRIPQGFYQSGLSVAIMEKQEEGFFLGDFSTSNSISDDKTKLIITFNYQSYDDKKETNQRKRNIKGLGRLLLKKGTK